MSGWRESIAQNLVSNLIWVALVTLLGVFGVVLAMATPIIALFAPFSYLVGALLVLLLAASASYIGARAWRSFNPLPAVAVSAPTEDPPPPYNEARVGLSNTLLEVHEARRIARGVLAERNGRYAGAVASMESALISTEKTFDIDTPQGSGDERKDLQLWLDYYEVVWPFLKKGNYDAAKGKAMNFIVQRGLAINPR